MCSANWAVVVAKAVSLGSCIKANQDGEATGVQVSPQNMINCSKNTDPCAGFSQMEDITGAMDLATKTGLNAVTDEVYTSFTTAKKENCTTTAGAFKVSKSTKLDMNVETMKAVLLGDQPLVAVMKLTPSLLIMTSGKTSNSDDNGLDYGYQAVLIYGFQTMDSGEVQWKFTSSWGVNWGFAGNGIITNTAAKLNAVYSYEM